jgi:hypothetical protein
MINVSQVLNLVLKITNFNRQAAALVVVLFSYPFMADYLLQKKWRQLPEHWNLHGFAHRELNSPDVRTARKLSPGTGRQGPGFGNLPWYSKQHFHSNTAVETVTKSYQLPCQLLQLYGITL